MASLPPSDQKAPSPSASDPYNLAWAMNHSIHDPTQDLFHYDGELPILEAHKTRDNKHLLPDKSALEPDDDSQALSKIPLNKNSSSAVTCAGEVDGLLRYASTGSCFSKPEFFRDNSDPLKVEETHFRMDQPDQKQHNGNSVYDFSPSSANRNHAQLPCILEGESSSEISPQRRAAASQLDKALSLQPLNIDLESGEFEPISEVVNPRAALNNNAQSSSENPGVPKKDTSNTSSQANPARRRGLRHVHADLRPHYEPEVKIYLAKVAIFIGFCLVLSVYAILIAELDFDYACVFGFFCMFCNAIIILDLSWAQSILAHLWFENDNVYQAFDILNLMILSFLVILRITNILSISVFAGTPFLSNWMMYTCKVGKNFKTKGFEWLLRLLYGIQAMIFTFKLDYVIDWEWTSVAIPSYILLGLLILRKILFVLKLFTGLIPGVNVFAHIKPKVMIWYCGYYSFFVLGLGAVIGTVLALPPISNLRVLAIIGYITAPLSLFMLGYTYYYRKILIEFMKVFGLVEGLLVAYELQENPPKPKKEISFKTEQKETYFVMLSSTYFVPMNKSFYEKGKAGLMKIKALLSKLRISKKEEIKPANTEGKSESMIDIKVLKQYKQHLDERMFNIKKFAKRADTKRVITTRMTSRKTRGAIDHEEISIDDNKLALSLGDLDQAQKLYNENASPKAAVDEDCCYLCFTNPRDAVLMDCGHGGICYECAGTLAQQRDECMECRKPIDTIYKIDPNPKILNIVKSTEFKKLEIKLIPFEF